MQDNFLVRVREPRRQVRRRHQRVLALATTCSSDGSAAPTSSPPSRTSGRKQPFGFIQGFGLNGVPYEEAATVDGAAAPDRHQPLRAGQVAGDAEPHAHLRPAVGRHEQPQCDLRDARSGASMSARDRTAASRRRRRSPRTTTDSGVRASARPTGFGIGSSHPSILRAAWGLYYAQTPPIFIPTGSGRDGRDVLLLQSDVLPPGRIPESLPGQPAADDPLLDVIGNPGINYIDPEFRNPRVSNMTVGYEYRICRRTLSASATYVYSHSDFLRTGGFSSTQWERNVVVDHVDEFGRVILAPQPRHRSAPLARIRRSARPTRWRASAAATSTSWRST